MRQRAVWVAALAVVAGGLSGCKGKEILVVDAGPVPPPADHELVVHGIITNSQTGGVLSDVKVTLLGTLDVNIPDAGDAGDDAGMDAGDGGPLVPVLTTHTDANGLFRFTGLPDAHNLLIRFEKDGYVALVNTLNPPGADDAPCAFDAGTPCKVASTARVIDASAALVPQFTLHVAGWVYAGTSFATGASVEIVSTDAPAIPVYQTTVDMKGHFDFPAVVPGTYQLLVLPFDANGNGVADYQLATVNLGSINTVFNDFTNIVVNLKDVNHQVVGGTFVNLSVPYPIEISDLMTGVTGIESPTKVFKLHFGAEVDPLLTSFELVQYDQINDGGQVVRHSSPIATTTAWDPTNVIVTITAGQDLTPSVTGYTSYQLRLHALRFKDGTISIPPSPTAFGKIEFTIGQLPVPLVCSQPSFYLGNQHTPKQTATHVAVDASNIWLLDKNNDFVFGTDPAANWGPNNQPQLQWPAVAGAVKYHVWGRTVNPGPLGTTQQWQEVATPVTAPSPELSPILATTIDPYQFPVITYSALPWAFNESVQFALTCEDAAGFQSPINDTMTSVLPTTDTFGGLLLNVAIDPPASPPYSSTTELGVTFYKTFRLDFSEPMNPQSPPTIVGTGNLRVNSTSALVPGTPRFVGWGDTNDASTIPLNAASSAYVNVSMTAVGACTETLVDRFVGDEHIQVRDMTVFDESAETSVVFLNATTGRYIYEATGISKTANDIVLAVPITGMGTLPVIPAHSLACTLTSETLVTKTNSISAGSNILTVQNAALFYVGETVLVYEPRGANPQPVADIRVIAGVDTSGGHIVLNSAPSAGHQMMTTIVVPMNVLGGEYQLRPMVDMSSQVAGDVTGGPGATINFLGVEPIMVGDYVLVDADGDLKTTTDQVVTVVTVVQFDPSAMPTKKFLLMADLPPTMFLYEKTSKVIGLGDSFFVGGTHDTSTLVPMVARPLDQHQDHFSPGGFLYGVLPAAK
jgi:hypothetical protein